MQRSSRRTPIRLITLKEAREIVRSKSSTNYKPAQDLDVPSFNTKRHLRAADSFQTIQTKSIENNLNLIQKAVAVKEAFTSPVKKSASPGKKQSSPRKSTCFNRKPTLIEVKKENKPNSFLINLAKTQEPLKHDNFSGFAEDSCKTEVICFIKGLEKLRYKLLKSNNLQ